MSLSEKAISLLKKLIKTPSFSKEEDRTAAIIEQFFQENGIKSNRLQNNVWAKNKFFNEKLPTILLNSHHDTVKPNISWTANPFEAHIENDVLTGLGSNDAGGPLVSLLATFLHFYDRPNLRYNFVMAATAEEEISGKNGIELLLPMLPKISFAVVGEPTQMHVAVAEKGLMVLDGIARGKAGHAARNEGENAIYKALKDIQWFETFRFPKVSETLGEVKMNVTVIEAGTQHNVIPDTCKFTVDVRATDAYSLEETLNIIQQNVQSKMTPRSMRLRPSGIPIEHPFVEAAVALGRNVYGSPTLSDQALMPFNSLKMGPGDSARSHTANEFIYLSEIKDGIQLYIAILNQLNL